MNRSYDFTGKVAFVTGAGQGIGLAISQAFTAAGAAVVPTDIQADMVTAAAEGIAVTGSRAIGFAYDVADEDQVTAAIAQTVKTYERLDIAFNNAGIQGSAVDLADQPALDFDRVIAINLRGTWARMKPKRSSCVRRALGRSSTMLLTGGLVAQPDLAA